MCSLSWNNSFAHTQGITLTIIDKKHCHRLYYIILYYVYSTKILIFKNECLNLTQIVTV